MKKGTKKNNKKKKNKSILSNMNNKMKMKLSILILLLVLILSSGISYAYFVATITNGNNGNNTIVTSGTMRINYSEGEYLNLDNALPGQSAYKNFTIENTGNLSTEYEIYLSEVLNTFVDKSDLVYSIVSTDANVNIENEQVPNEPTKMVNKQTLPVGETHHYRLTITFLNKNEEQNDNQGAMFTAKIGINESKEIIIPASNVTYNNLSVQDALSELKELLK